MVARHGLDIGEASTKPRGREGAVPTIGSQMDEPDWLLTSVNSLVLTKSAGQLAGFSIKDRELACFYLRKYLSALILYFFLAKMLLKTAFFLSSSF